MKQRRIYQLDRERAGFSNSDLPTSVQTHFWIGKHLGNVRKPRKEERIVTALPVKLGETMGLTRDVSAAGIFFEIDAACIVGSDISFAIELESPTGKIMLKCKGNIVRTEPRNNQLGVAVKISESMMEEIA